MNVIAKRIFVSGRVQGVFFRDSTQKKARELKLDGAVRNLRDGRVEVLVRGEIQLVQRLINWLEIGPKHAKVTTIEVIDEKGSDEDLGINQHFSIWPTK